MKIFASKKGVSLIEVITAVVIISIITTGFIGVMNGNFKMLMAARKNTQDIYTAQTNLINAEENARVELALGNLATDKIINKPFNLINEIKVHQFETDVDGKYIATWLCPNPLFTIVTPQVESVKLKIYKKADGVEQEVKYPYACDYSNLIFRAEESGNTGFKNKYCWYIALKERQYFFNIPIYDPEEITEVEWGTRYPVFPANYVKIAETSVPELTIDPNMSAGGHIIVTVQPEDANGNVGDIKISNPVYVHFLLFAEGLRTHFDANVVNFKDGDYVTQDLPIQLEKWLDLANDARDTGIDDQHLPLFGRSKIFSNFKTQKVIFDNSSSIQVVDEETKGHYKTIFFVTKYSEGDVVFKNKDTEIKDVLVGREGKIRVFYDRIKTEDAISVIGNSEFELYEMLIYDDILSDDEILKVFAGLSWKYSIYVSPTH